MHPEMLEAHPKALEAAQVLRNFAWSGMYDYTLLVFEIQRITKVSRNEAAELAVEAILAYEHIFVEAHLMALDIVGY